MYTTLNRLTCLIAGNDVGLHFGKRQRSGRVGCVAEGDDSGDEDG